MVKPKKNRDAVIFVRVRPDEAKRLALAAEAKGLSVSSFVRMCAVEIAAREEATRAA